jgi:hypothetical protein
VLHGAPLLGIELGQEVEGHLSWTSEGRGLIKYFSRFVHKGAVDAAETARNPQGSWRAAMNFLKLEKLIEQVRKGDVLHD